MRRNSVCIGDTQPGCHCVQHRPADGHAVTAFAARQVVFSHRQVLGWNIERL